jgi:hypothetical protein
LADGEGHEAVHIHAHEFDAAASDTGLRILERMWREGLAWSHDNPWLFMAVIALLAFGLWCWSRSSERRAAMRIEYEERRAKARASRQERLPFDGG